MKTIMTITTLALMSALTACANSANPIADARPIADALGGASDAPATDAALAASDVRLNEVAAGDSPDWFELVNVGASAVSLDGYYFCDDIVNTNNHAAFPTGTILPAHGFVVQDVDSAGVGFALGAGEALSLWKDDGDGIPNAADTRIDIVDWNTGDAPAGGSFARMPDGSGAFVTDLTSTPGATNQ